MNRQRLIRNRDVRFSRWRPYPLPSIPPSLVLISSDSSWNWAASVLTVQEGQKVSLDWYIGRLTAEHGIISFTFFDFDALQKRENECATGKSILNSRAPDSSRGGSTARSQHRMGRLWGWVCAVEEAPQGCQTSRQSLCCGGEPTGISTPRSRYHSIIHCMINCNRTNRLVPSEIIVYV